MNSRFLRLVRLPLLLLLALIAFPALAAKEHSQMHEALDALRAAKTSAKPVDDLQTAVERLKAGNTNKAGHRAEAVRLVRKAIDELKAKRKIPADKLIDEAIHEVEKAVAVSKERGRR